MAAEVDLTAWMAETRRWVDAELESALRSLAGAPPEHLGALRYALLGPGKRVRPALVRLVCAELGGRDADALAPAAAVETIHAYSLVHDDLPCMDDDDLRRGRPTCHRVWGEAEAVLVGDGLQSLAFGWLARRGGERAAELVAVLADAAGSAGMVGGQSLDLSVPAREESAPHDGARAVRDIHELKTAALIGGAAEMGAIAAGAGAAAREAMAGYGRALGRLFQALDDVLDVTSDARALGKTPGKDAAANKATLVTVLGLEGARDEARRLAETARACAREAGCEAGSPPLAFVDHFLVRSS